MTNNKVVDPIWSELRDFLEESIADGQPFMVTFDNGIKLVANPAKYDEVDDQPYAVKEHISFDIYPRAGEFIYELKDGYICAVWPGARNLSDWNIEEITAISKTEYHKVADTEADTRKRSEWLMAEQERITAELVRIRRENKVDIQGLPN